MSADERSGVTHELLLGARMTVRARHTRPGDDLREIPGRPGVLEMQYAGLSNRVDRMDQRLDPVERRLDPIAG